MADPAEQPARELVVDAKAAPGDGSSSSGAAMAPFALTAIVAGALAKLASPTIALVGAGAAVVVALALRKPREGPFVLRVDDGVLIVYRERGRAPGARIALVDLLDVTIERQTRPAAARGGGTSERARLALEPRAPGAPVFVPAEHVTSLEAQEWHGKVRVFLRKHGWVPGDER